MAYQSQVCFSHFNLSPFRCEHRAEYITRDSKKFLQHAVEFYNWSDKAYKAMIPKELRLC